MEKNMKKKKHFMSEQRIWKIRLNTLKLMEKNKTAELYKDLIKANIASINKMLNEINGNTIDSYTCCKFAVEVSKINEGYYSRLAVLKPAESNFLKDDMYSSKKLQLRALEIANNIPVCIVIENDVNGQIAQAFASVFKNLGFKTTFNPGSRYMVAGSVTFSESKTSDNKRKLDSSPSIKKTTIKLKLRSK